MAPVWLPVGCRPCPPGEGQCFNDDCCWGLLARQLGSTPHCCTLLFIPLLQTDLQDAGLGDSSVSGTQYIKPEHLSLVIACSHADFLIVVGDKNAKHDTVQVRRDSGTWASRDEQQQQQQLAGAEATAAAHAAAWLRAG